MTNVLIFLIAITNPLVPSYKTIFIESHVTQTSFLLPIDLPQVHAFTFLEDSGLWLIHFLSTINSTIFLDTFRVCGKINIHTLTLDHYDFLNPSELLTCCTLASLNCFINQSHSIHYISEI